MKTLRLLIVLSVFLMQSAMLPYSYAANAPVTTEQTASDAMQIERAKQMVQQFFSISLSDKKPLDIVQIGAYLYAYDVYGERALDFYRGPDARALKIVDEFISKYAPNLGFTVAGQTVDQAVIEQKAITWNKDFNKEYLDVVAYIQSIQAKYKDKNITTPTAPTTTKPTTTTTPTGKSSCELLVDKLMQEYNTLISINAPYEKIADVKRRISDAQSGKECSITPKEAITKEVVQQKNEQAIESVKKALNFEALNIKVVPDRVGAYCDSSSTSVLRSQLSNLGSQEIDTMKQTITTLMDDPAVQQSAVKANALDSISQELAYAAATQASADGQSTSAFRNMVQGLYLMGNSIINGDGASSVLGVIDANMDKLSYIGEFIGEQFDGLSDIRSKGGILYSWDATAQGFKKGDNTNGSLAFTIPADKDGKKTATLSIVAAKSQIVNVSEKMQSQGSELSLSDFVSQAKQNGAIRSYPINPSTVGATLAQEIMNYGGQMYDGNNQLLTVFVAEVNGHQRLFKDYNLTAVMPSGKFTSPWDMTYIVGTEGKLVDIYRTEEQPKQLKGKLEVDGMLKAGFELNINYDEKAIAAGMGNSFPLSINGKLFVAPYLISFDLKRELKGSTRDVTGGISITGPAICQSTISLSMQYNDDGKGYAEPLIGSADETNVKSTTITINHNQNKLTANISDLIGLVTAMESFIGLDPANEGDIPGIMDIINPYVTVAYLFNDTQLATIVADPDTMASIVYNDNSKEGLLDVLGSYMYLLRLDRVMQYLGPLFASQESPEQATPGKEVDYRTFKLNSFSTDENNITLDYYFQNKDGSSTSLVYPNKVDLVVYTKDDSCTNAFCSENTYAIMSVDGYTYTEAYMYLLNDPSVVAAYIYANYTDEDGGFFEDTYYIIGNEDSIKETPSVDYRAFKLNSFSTDETNINIDYYFQNQDGSSTSLVYPNKVDLVVYTKGDDCPDIYCSESSYSMMTVDGYTYTEPYMYLLNDPAVVAAYIYASYTDELGDTFDYTHYVVGSPDSIKQDSSEPAKDTSPAYAYTIGAQSSYQEAINTDYWSFGLYDDQGIFIEYIKPTVQLYITNGSNCYDTASVCTKDTIELYANDINGVPTYTVDRAIIDDANVFEAGISLQYTDINGAYYSQGLSIKATK